MFPRTVPSEISEEIPTNSPRKCFFGMSLESLILGIPSEFSEEIPRKFYFPTTILVGMSSEYRYSEDIPTIFVVGIPLGLRKRSHRLCSLWISISLSVILVEEQRHQEHRSQAHLSLIPEHSPSDLFSPNFFYKQIDKPKLVNDAVIDCVGMSGKYDERTETNLAESLTPNLLRLIDRPLA
ncbi:hypothetical protein YC2023_050480 [Brassica napus]